ncbi:MAG: AAA family ATPase [Gammaproteobacteria bacterium]|nr:AAA family ATPase [Gammaproteobacteria bacterium]
MNKLIVISGCSGGGKSSLLSALSDHGYYTIPEVGRQIVKEQLEVNGSITPWDNPTEFCEMIITRSVAVYHQVQSIKNPKKNLVFFDRSFLDGVSYYQTLKILDSRKYDHFIDELRYYPTIFMTPPWPEIFCNDDERKHSFEDAVIEYSRLLGFYASCGYKILEIPKISIKKRLQFVISNISLK